MICFSAFLGQKSLKKKFGSNIFRLKLTRAIDWCMNCHIWLRKNFDPFLPKRGDPYQKKVETELVIVLELAQLLSIYYY
jgi:hypothetical protein